MCALYSTVVARADVFVPVGEAGDGACEAQPAPCGGSPVGEWTLQTSCGPPLVFPSNPFAGLCPGANFEAQPPVRSGTLSVDASGHFELSMVTTYDYTFGADITCLGAFDCGAMAEQAVGAAGGAVSCSGHPLSCDCTVTGVELEAVEVEGDGALDGREVLVGSDLEPHPYCVTDGRLELWTLPAGPLSTGVICEQDDDCKVDDPALNISVCVPI